MNFISCALHFYHIQDFLFFKDIHYKAKVFKKRNSLWADYSSWLLLSRGESRTENDFLLILT